VFCKCSPSYHPQPVSYDEKGNLKTLFHKCATCKVEWAYGTAAPVCQGAPVVAEEVDFGPPAQPSLYESLGEEAVR